VLRAGQVIDESRPTEETVNASSERVRRCMTEPGPERHVRPQPFRNWSGLVRFTPHACARPDSEAALSAVVRAAAHEGRKLRVRGSGHSFVPLVETDGVLVSLERMAGIESHDTHSARIHAGTTLDRLGRELWARGLGMLNLGDINKQSLGGAVGTGTHGTGRALGSISSQVEALTLVLADGQVRGCSAAEDPELFAAARVSLGALGIITRLSVKLRPAYKLKLTKSTADLDDCLAQCEALAQRHRHFEFYWFPHTHTVGLKCMDETDEPESQRALTYLNELLLENGALELISRVARLRPAWAPRLARLIAWSMKGDAGTMVSDCHRAFSSPRFVRFHEMEYELPAPRPRRAARAQRVRGARSRCACTFRSSTATCAATISGSRPSTSATAPQSPCTSTWAWTTSPTSAAPRPSFAATAAVPTGARCTPLVRVSWRRSIRAGTTSSACVRASIPGACS
jgi:L-gulonolactone oxidase